MAACHPNREERTMQKANPSDALIMTTSTDNYRLRNARADHPLWFERDAMRFFGTRVHEERSAGTAVYVVTSEAPPDGPRTWNVRRFDSDNSDTIGPSISTGWGSHARALRIAESLAEHERNGAITVRPNRGDTFRPCETCQRNGDEYPSWASFIVYGRGDTCAEHLYGTGQ